VTERHGGGWHGGGPHWGRGRHAPPWWPEGEAFGPPWQGARRFRRRFLTAALVFVGFVVGFMFLVGLLFGRDHAGDRRDRDRGPFPLIGVVVGITAVTAVATTIAYRRLSGPVGNLLGAAEHVASGDFDVTVAPDGPRELRTLATAFNDMASRLADTDEQRRRFLADVSHELRTPLAVLQSGIEAQLDGVHPRDDQHLVSLLDETHRLGRLVNDLHTLALAEAGQIVLHREPTNPVTLAEDAVAGHRALAERSGVRLRLTSPGAAEIPVVEVDPSRIRQVLDNLLANALRHTPSDGNVVVSVGSSADSVRLAVMDTGPGFPPDQLGTVFDRFTRSGDSEGSGLGLSIARDLVQAHGGTITATNASRGGAVVTFTLPLPA
jgi:signal transduction histidine kinase